VDAVPIVLVVILGLGFAWTNGFHDAANSVATSISTRALTPAVAVALAAVANLVGAFFGEKVARTIGSDVVDVTVGSTGLAVVAAGLLGAVAWNTLTWWFAMPSSSTHALIGGLCGAGLVGGATVKWDGVIGRVAIPMVASPIAGVLVGYLSMVALLWIFRRSNPVRAARGFRYAQTASASAMAFGHGLQDAAKAAAAVTLGLTAAGHQHGIGIPLWALALCALAMGLGTYAGGWRIMRTLGQRIIPLDPPRGFAAESAASGILYVSGLVAGAPISTTYTIASTILGVGFTGRLTAVRWSVVRRIGLTWLLTPPAAGLIAAACFVVLRLL
jgi:PiT family inorganic phosphate transporter